MSRTKRASRTAGTTVWRNSDETVWRICPSRRSGCGYPCRCPCRCQVRRASRPCPEVSRPRPPASRVRRSAGRGCFRRAFACSRRRCRRRNTVLVGGRRCRNLRRWRERWCSATRPEAGSVRYRGPCPADAGCCDALATGTAATAVSSASSGAFAFCDGCAMIRPARVRRRTDNYRIHLESADPAIRIRPLHTTWPVPKRSTNTEIRSIF